MIERTGSVEERLERLEQKCRRLRAWCAGTTSLLLVACAAAALDPGGDIVRARRFEAIDRDGEIRAVLAGDFEDGIQGAGLRVGELDDDASAFIGVAPVTSVGSDEAKPVSLLHLECDSGGDPYVVSAWAAPTTASHKVASGRRSINAHVEPQESFLVMNHEPSNGRSVSLFEVLIEGDQPTLTVRAQTSDVLFRQP